MHHECRSRHVTPLQPKSAFMILFVQGVFWLFGKRAEKKTSRFQTATSRKFVDPGNNLNLQDSPQTPNFELFFGFCKLHRLKNTRPAIQNETNILFLTHTQFFGLEDFCCAYFHSIHGNNFHIFKREFLPRL